MIDVRKLGMLSALQRLGTIAAVADELQVTAPGVSMQLSALEKDLGMQLTARQGRRIALTPAGRVLATHGRDILDRISVAEVELGALREGTVGRYTVTAFPSAARTFLADACRTIVADDASALELRITTLGPRAALADLAAGTVDLAVIHSYSNVPSDLPAGIEVRTIGTEPVWLAVRSAETVGDAPSSRLEDYADSPWIAPTSDATCFDMVVRACGLAGFRPRVVAETMDFPVQLELVAAGVGVALIPDLTFDRLPPGVQLLTPVAPVTRTIHVAARTHGFADAGILRLADTIDACASAILESRRP